MLPCSRPAGDGIPGNTGNTKRPSWHQGRDQAQCFGVSSCNSDLAHPLPTTRTALVATEEKGGEQDWGSAVQQDSGVRARLLWAPPPCGDTRSTAQGLQGQHQELGTCRNFIPTSREVCQALARLCPQRAHSPSGTTILNVSTTRLPTKGTATWRQRRGTAAITLLRTQLCNLLLFTSPP